ncbi:hypothetical protein BJ742DRAFT_405546 [Cladochytrium replicatum]|nr:hypothetical protein BJ742DRAFT_405546 [Cladochytrium replicatum]
MDNARHAEFVDPPDYTIEEPEDDTNVPQSPLPTPQDETGWRDTSSEHSAHQRDRFSAVVKGLGFLIRTAKVVTNVSFETAKLGTKVGLGIAKGVVDGVGSATGLATVGVTPLISGTLSLAEWIATTGIDAGKFWTGVGLRTGSEALETLDMVFGSSDTALAFAEFVALVKRETLESNAQDLELIEQSAGFDNPPEALRRARIDAAVYRPGWMEITRGLTGWVCLQYVTRTERDRIFWAQLGAPNASIRLVNLRNDGYSVELPDEIVEFVHEDEEQGRPVIRGVIGHASSDVEAESENDQQISQTDRDQHLLSELKRYVKFGSGAYGRFVISLFYGSEPSAPDSNPQASTSTSSSSSSSIPTVSPRRSEESYPRVSSIAPTVHPDKDAFARHAQVPHSSFYHSTHDNNNPNDPFNLIPETSKYRPTFYLLVDHSTREVIISFRGTLSLHDLMVDLASDYENYDDPRLPSTFVATDDGYLPAYTRDEETNGSGSATNTPELFKVHSGMMRVARSLAQPNSPTRLYEAVISAMETNPGYSLLLTGHSLGAGIASLLTLLWTDPRTSHTRDSTMTTTDDIALLPPGRKIRCIGFGSPCTMSEPLSRICRPFITSVVIGDDIIGRLSVGSVRDLRNVCSVFKNGAQLGIALPKDADGGSGTSGLVRELMSEVTQNQNAAAANAEFTRPEYPPMNRDWVKIWDEVRREAVWSELLYPAGRVLWIVPKRNVVAGRDGGVGGDPIGGGEWEIVEAQELRECFGHLVFSSDMLALHMPNSYERVIGSL